MAALRQGEAVSAGTKVLIILDQFEQWLHATANQENTNLAQALRQCDGAGVQCIVLVRDDFWMATTRVMRELEIRLVEGQNCNAVDTFPPRHAKKVLAAFGRAFGALPENANKTNSHQKRFLNQAVQGLAQDGKVVCVRLAMFAQMMKDRHWSPATLKQLGGMPGVGSTFLEETFCAATAPASHRCHQQAARALLKALLPESGTDIKGHMRPYDSLLEATGYASRRERFDDLLRILDTELRLITPTDPDISLEANSQTDTREKSYQLTHDYLVLSLRNWLTRKQQESRRGRAELNLEERSDLWNSKQENRFLPSLVEFLSMRFMTRKSTWTSPQRAMMNAARRFLGIRWGSVLVVLLLVGLMLRQTVSMAHHRNMLALTTAALDAVGNASGHIVPTALTKLDVLPRDVVLHELRDRYLECTNAKRKLHLAYAWAHHGEVKTDFLLSMVQQASPDEASNLCTALEQAREESLSGIREAIFASKAGQRWRLMARLATMALHLDDPLFAINMCRFRDDPIQRSVFIDEYALWHGDTTRIAKFATTIDDSAWRSALCLAVASVPREEAGEDAEQVWNPIFADWYRNQPDSATHSAAGWALRQWDSELPAIEDPRGTRNRAWQVNSLGMTMVAVPAGTFLRNDDSMFPGTGEQKVALTHSFLLSDREISRRQFQRFLQSPNLRPDEKPTQWSVPRTAAEISPTADHPMNNVSWFDAVLFCNWLSRKEGFVPAYERVGKARTQWRHEMEDWRWIRDADGYRLPTEAEWEFACRAGASTRYCCGDSGALLDRYGVFGVGNLEVCGGKLPNNWGLFEMPGNVSEWCYDWSGAYPRETSLRDPIGADTPDEHNSRIKRGGTFFDYAGKCGSGSRNRNGAWSRADYDGFRIARTPSS